MKKLCVIIASVGILSCSSLGVNQPTNWQEKTKRIAKMDKALQELSIEEFMKTIQIAHWSLPCIPSEWFVTTCVTNQNEKDYLQTVRDFGYKIALRLDDLAKEQQTLPQDDTLFQRTLLLCDLGDWCAETVGYGNIFLAYRCLDLSAVGLARLTVSLEFPLASCEKIATRINPSWLGMAYRLQVLNDEVGTNIFINPNVTDEELNDQWAVGWTMREIAEGSETIKEMAQKSGFTPSLNANFVNIKAFTNNLHFFLADEHIQGPLTLSTSWNARRHRRVAMGLFIQAHDKALSLLKFRSVVGFFPSPFVRNEEEIKQDDVLIAEYAKKGIKVSKLEDDPTYDSLKEAFRMEWEKNSNKNTKEYVKASRTYKEVMSKTMFDGDTAQIQTEKQRKKIKAQSEMK